MVTHKVVEIKVKVANFQLINLSNCIFLGNLSELDRVNFGVNVLLKLRLDLDNELEKQNVYKLISI